MEKLYTFSGQPAYEGWKEVDPADYGIIDYIVRALLGFKLNMVTLHRDHSSVSYRLTLSELPEKD